MKSIPLHHVWQYTDVDRAFWQERLEAWVPRKVFDAHTHVNEPRFRRGTTTEAKRSEHWMNEVSEPIGAADAQRCHELVFPGRQVSCLTFGYPLSEYDIEDNKAGLQQECVRRGWYRLAIVRPQWPAERVDAELKLPNTLGVITDWAWSYNDRTTGDTCPESSIYDFLPHHQLELLNERRAWVNLHVANAERLCHPANVAEIRQIRRQYAKVVLVIAHLGGVYTRSQAQRTLSHFADDEGLLFDISAVFNPEVLQFALEVLGPARLLYGTDNPIFYMRGRQQRRDGFCVNHTDYPFHFNRDREPPAIESTYTLYMYEALWALRQACEAAGVQRAYVEAIFHDNARQLIDFSTFQGILP